MTAYLPNQTLILFSVTVVCVDKLSSFLKINILIVIVGTDLQMC